MEPQFPEKVYPKSHIIKIMGIDMLIFLAGLLCMATPLVHKMFPGDLDTTAHVALGALIATIAMGKVLIAHGSIWMDVVLIVLGGLAAAMPRIQHMQWEPHYNMGHLVVGIAIIALSLLSILLTLPVLKQVKIV